MGAVTRALRDVGRLADIAQRGPDEVSTPEGRARERHRRMIFSAGAAGLSKIVSVGTALITVPLTLHYLGTERYGIWMTMSSLIAMFNFADLGIGYGVLNVVADSSGRDDGAAMRGAVSSGFFVLSGIALVILALFALAYPLVPWPVVFNAESETARLEAGPSFASLAVCFALAIPIGMVQRVQMGLQQGFLVGLWQCLASVMGLAGVLVAIHFEAPLPWLILGLVGAPLVAGIVNNVVFFGMRRTDLLPAVRHVSQQTMLRVARTGVLFFVLQISFAIIFMSDNLIIAHSLGSSAVTEYAVPRRLFALVGTVLAMLLSPLWPAYGEALARRDHAWVRRTLRRSVWIAVSFATVLCAALVIFGDRLMRLWVGPVIDAPLILLLGLAAWQITDACSNAIAMFLNGANVFRFQIAVSCGMSLLAIVLKLLLVQEIGISGVVWGTVITYAVSLPVTYLYLRRKLGAS
jgi:O-antigen/teichoic acid export membrane protein